MAGLSKAWLAEFLLIRGIVPSPDGRRLFRYNVDEEEFAALRSLLQRAASERTNPIHGTFWAAGYCLFVAEKYRREYDGGEGGWSWQGFDRSLGLELTHQDHSSLTTKGLSHWARPIRLRASGHDYLGSLFDEGGLPWKLLSSETHGFARAVNGGVHAYYRDSVRGTQLFEVVRRYDVYFPKTFRTEDKYQLIADIVMWLVGLAERHPLSEQEDPAAYLDSFAPDWRSAAPLPISSENGRNLANYWLRDASQRRRERQQHELDVRNFTSEHALVSDHVTDWTLVTTLYLPNSIDIPLDEMALSSSRIEVMCYEGKFLLTKAGVIYGKYREDLNQLSVAFTSRRLQVERRHPEEPLTLQLFAGGQLIAAQYIEFSDVAFQDQPLVFVERDSVRVLAATASAVLPETEAWLYLPTNAKLSCEGPTESLGEDKIGGHWVSITDHARITVGDAHYSVELGSAVGAKSPRLHGILSRFDTLPGLTFHGWPVVMSAEQQPLTGFRTMIDGQYMDGRQSRPLCGVVNFQVVDDQGATLLRKRLGMLPNKLRIAAYAGTPSSPARVIVRSPEYLDCDIQNDDIQVTRRKIAEDLQFELDPRIGKRPPKEIQLQLKSLGSAVEPVTVRLPFPEAGVQFVNRHGEDFASKKMSITDLLGMELVLTAVGEVVEDFHITLSPKASRRIAVQRNYKFRVGRQPLRISAYSFKEDIENLMAGESTQDAEVRLQVSTSASLAQIDISRYGASLEASPDLTSVQLARAAPGVVSGGGVLAMSLSDPALAPVALLEKTSEGVETGIYEVPRRLYVDGPWLLVPPRSATQQYRPLLWMGDGEHPAVNESDPEITLHTAARLYHPRENPHIFDRVIGSMATDPSHSGWGYLSDLYKNFGYLPLSVFQSWRALAQVPEALAMAMYRLDIPENFSRQCMYELAVVWEAMPLRVWSQAEEHYGAFFRARGVDPILLVDILEQKRKRLAGVTPGYKLLGDGDPTLKAMTLGLTSHLLGDWYMGLRRRNAHNDDWPTYLTQELTVWVEHQNLPAMMKQLPQVGFHAGVTYLPIFLASVAAGLADLEDLNVDLWEFRAVHRILSDFDRDAWFEPAYEIVLAYLLTTKSSD